MEEAKRNLDLVSGNHSAYSNERVGAIDSRYLHPDERELAAKLAEASDGQFTAEEIRDTLRHALLAEPRDYPQGLSDYVLDTAQATDETLQTIDGSEGRLVVTQDANGNARYLIQNIVSIPLNDDAKAYIQEQGLGYRFIEQAKGSDDVYQAIYRDRGPGSLAMATGLQFNLDTVDVRTLDEIDHDLKKLNFGMANAVALPISGGTSLYAYGAKKTLGYVSVAAGFDVVGQWLQDGEYRPGQTVQAAHTALTLGPLLGSSIKGNTFVGGLAGGSNVAANNFYYDENKGVALGALFGGFTSTLATGAGNAVSRSFKGIPSSIELPYFQTPATISFPLPNAITVGNSVETMIQNSTAFISLPNKVEKTEKSDEDNGNEE